MVRIAASPDSSDRLGGVNWPRDFHPPIGGDANPRSRRESMAQSVERPTLLDHAGRVANVLPRPAIVDDFRTLHVCRNLSTRCRDIASSQGLAVVRQKRCVECCRHRTHRHACRTRGTVRAWLRRADDDLLVQTKTPVNRFPDFVRYAIQHIKLFCPTLGRVKIADMLARAGIHIGKTTVGRILKEKPVDAPKPTTDDPNKQCRIVSKYPGHTWHADLTVVPISGGFWTHWTPHAIWQRWPVCW